MPRPRKQVALDATVVEIVAAAAQQIVQAVRQDIAAQVARVVRGEAEFAPRRGKGPRSRRGPVHCVYPGCTRPHKGPRFSFLCEEHRNISAAEKAKLKAAKAGKPRAESKTNHKARRRTKQKSSAKATNGKSARPTSAAAPSS
jgi:hypothetical protein